MLVLLTALLLVALLCWLEWRIRHHAAYRVAQQLPGPPIYPLIGNMLDVFNISQGNANARFFYVVVFNGINYKFSNHSRLSATQGDHVRPGLPFLRVRLSALLADTLP